MNYRTVDILIVAVFVISIALIGIVSGGKQKSMKDYFLGAEKVPWWIVCFSIIAAETSTLTFISIPGLAYLTNLNFLQVTFGYFIGRLLVAKILLPEYFNGDLTTAYSYLETRFGSKTRSLASIVFLITRTMGDGVRLFTAAIPVKLLLGIDYQYAIIIIALVALLYTYTGGVKGVIWVDAIQMLFYVGGSLLSLFYIISVLPQGINSFLSVSSQHHKLDLINLTVGNNGFSSFFAQPYNLIAAVIGGIFLSMASHGTDQLIVQRLLATGNVKSGQKAIIMSGAIIIFQFALFLLLGVALFVLYDGKVFAKSDEIFPIFILEKLPVGVSGLLISGILAAALSTLSSALTSLSSSTMFDLFLPRIEKKNYSDERLLSISRKVTIGWTFIIILSAMFWMSGSRAMVEIALSIASFTFGGLLGTFLLGIINKRAKQEDAIAAFLSAIFIMVTVVSLKLTAWTWFTIIGVVATVSIGTFLSSIKAKDII